MKPFLGFRFKGIHTGDYDLLVKTRNFPLLAPRKETRIAVPGRQGELIFDGGPENKILSFTLTFVKPLLERRKDVRQIAAWLSNVGSLYMDYESDKEYKVVKVVSDINIAMEWNLDEFDVEFECEPIQLGKSRTYLQMPTGGLVIVQNDGTAHADTRISITAYGDVDITADGKHCRLSDMNGTLLINSKLMTVTDAFYENMIHKHSGDFIRIPPDGTGIGTGFSVTGASGMTDLYYWEAWL